MQESVAYQEEFREELLDGQAVAMSPRPSFNHNQVAFNIAFLFRRHLWGKSCTPIADGMDLYLRDGDVFIPDMMVVCDRSLIQDDGVHGTPDLVVEVLSPSTARRDRGYKKDVYEACGVPEYWIVSPSERSVEVYLLQDGHYRLDNLYSLYPDFLLAKLSETERAALVTQFRCHLYDDLSLRLEDIFCDLY